MKKKLQVLGKGEEDLVKNSATMNDIDMQADNDSTANLVGGIAYDSSDVDKMTTARLLNIQLSGEKQTTESDDKFVKNTVVNILVAILGIILVLLVTFIIYQIIHSNA